MKIGIIAKLGLAGAFGAITYALGGWDKLLYCFLVFIVLDYLTGVAAAVYKKQLSSSTGVMGIIKKLLLVCLVWMAAALDSILAPGNPYIRDVALLCLISNESISILENFGRMDIIIPPILRRVLAQVEDKAEVKGGKA